MVKGGKFASLFLFWLVFKYLCHYTSAFYNRSMQQKPSKGKYTVSLLSGGIFSAFFLSVFLLILAGCSPNKKAEQPAIAGSDLEIGETLMQKSLFDSALVYYRRSADFNLKKNAWDTWYRGIAGMIDCYRANGNYEEAIRLSDQADVIAKNKIDTTGSIYAGIVHKKALLLTDKQNYQESIALLQKSIGIRNLNPIKNDTAIALSFNALGINYLYLGFYDKALENYQKAITLYKNRPVKNADLAMFNQNVGIVYAIMGDYDNARNFFHEALTINQQLIAGDDPKLAVVYLNYGRYYSLIGNDREALSMYTRAEGIFKNKKETNTNTVASLYHNIGNIYANNADYDKALLYFNKALSLYKSLTSEGEQKIPAILSNIGFIYEKEGNYQLALENYLQSVEKGKNSQNIVTIYRNLANIYFVTNNPDDAFVYYDLALDQSKAIFGETHPETALTYLKFGEFLSLTGKNDEAIADLNKGLKIYQNLFGEKNPDVATALKFIGNHYTRHNEFDKALTYFQQSLVAGFADFNSLKAEDNPAISKKAVNYFMLNSLNGKAYALKSLYQEHPAERNYLIASANAYDESVKMIELLRSSYQNEESKLMIAGNEGSTFRNAIQVNAELYRLVNDPKYLEKALELSEKGKSAVLLSNIRNLEAKQVGKIPDILRDQENKIKEEIGLYEKLVYDEKTRASNDTRKIDLWNNKLFELNNKYDSLITVFEKEYPAYYKMKYDNSVLELHEVQSKLSGSQVVIEYTMNDTSFLYAFVITRNSFDLKTIPLKSLFFSDINVLSGQMSGKSFNNYTQADLESFIAASRRLYNVLIPKEISNKLPENLIIIPDGELGYLSFDILLTNDPENAGNGYRNLPYLIRKSAINYAPSATMLFGGSNNNLQAGHDVLAFAPSYSNLNGQPVDQMMNRQSAQNFLLPIPGAQIEVKNLRKIFKCRVFEDAKATKDNFKKYAGNYSILHLAMHTLIDDANPLYSKLVFYKDDSKGDGSLLNTYELFNMQLNAQLAVLSACNTGKGKLVNGEGILSLSRGFFYAGVPSVIMTLWAVEDRSGADLMTSFYKNLSDGKTKDAALRLAKLDYLKASDQMRSHPHFWAAYLSIGNTSPLKDINKPVSTFYYILGSAILLLLIAAGIWLIKRRIARR